MKTNYNLLKSIAIALLFTSVSWGQITITQWNFNGTSPTTVAGGATSPTPVIGSGSAELVGGVTATFASGVSSGGSSDPVITAPDNYGWNVTGYAPLGTESKQRGIQFNVSTLGYQGITFRFDQRLSNTSNNTYVVQYTADRTAGTPVWVDGPTFTFTPAPTLTGDVWYNLRTADFTGVTALNDNANAAFRIVSAFDPGVGNYTASTSTSTYSVTGTTRFDMATVTAVSLGVDQFNTTKNAFTVYPNPSNKEIVNFNQAQDVQVFDALGKLVLTAQNTKSIDTKSFHSGVYFIKTAKGTQKLIVK
jgi:hypothetical protein